jgi:site-specific DNA recombinase
MSAPKPETPERPTVRCAIYTRKSTSEGLEMDFNTLDAQREAAEYYIRAMKHEGWVALEARYDDGGFTGANTERPALKRLLADIEAGGIDCVVVYKVDRLSRSLLDFAQLLAIFDDKKVGFVSTTQHFNTRDAMGRLTLNIVVSFAQFEREMIADRTRDKMGAARKRGKWLGSRPPLGYDGDRERMRLVVHGGEAERVRTIFDLYLRLGSMADVAIRLNELGWEKKRWRTRAGVDGGGGAWDQKDVHQVLRNPLYIGKVRFEGALYDGEHEAIVPEGLFAQVKETLAAKSAGRGKRRGRNPEFVIASLVRCGLCGAPMVTAGGKGRRGETYRYYVCRNRTRHTNTPCDHPRTSAPEIEGLVVQRVRRICGDADMRAKIAERMSVLEPKMAESIANERADVEAKRALVRAEAERILDALGDGPGGRLVAGRIGELERQLDGLNSQAATLDGQLMALTTAAEEVRDTMKILEAFDEAWEAFDPRERQELVKVLVKAVTVNEPAGSLEVEFHDLDGPFDAPTPAAAQEACP